MQVRYRTAPTAPTGPRVAATGPRYGRRTISIGRFRSQQNGYEVLMTEQHTTPSGATRQAEKAAAGKEHQAGRPATEQEAGLADRNTVSDGVAEHEQEMLERGANQRGEGRVG